MISSFSQKLFYCSSHRNDEASLYEVLLVQDFIFLQEKLKMFEV